MNSDNPQQPQTPDPNLQKLEEDLKSLETEASNTQQQTAPVQPVVPAPTEVLTPTMNPVVPPTTSTGSPKKNSLMLIAIILVVLALLAAIAYVIGMQFFGQKTVPTPVATVIETPSPSPTADPTADWKTYENKNAQISFKYPSQVSEVSGEGGSYVSGPVTGNSDIVVGFEDKSTIRPNTDAAYDGFTIYEIDPGLIKSFTFDSYLNSELAAVKTSPRGIQTATVQRISLGTQNFSYIDSEINIRRYYILSPDSKRMAIFSRINNTQEFLTTFDQILSTFKFIEATPSSSPTTAPVGY